MTSRSLWAWLYWLPVRRTDQTLFAEALSQTLGAGLEISAAIGIAASVHPNRRFRAALREMVTNCRRAMERELSWERQFDKLAPIVRDKLMRLGIATDLRSM